eukprot:CAMPEP_0198732968 /NCGR_PEP_ID=MMETSP1475-20131203/41479_1 /TAXON_ID= ORGANISM="Unidentified sp., Strain CCMP1999" /NCGR_SAMPLE_ID=MMETSP1475 /ASSEMBLY_ACC=CAM_ASM_001111 /LENGTH=318 /DNA_ID=CAMNT_0044496181 /DNA_START=98 /DNA_END=1051 /DNA_ORIENTATION=+
MYRDSALHGPNSETLAVRWGLKEEPVIDVLKMKNHERRSRDKRSSQMMYKVGGDIAVLLGKTAPFDTSPSCSVQCRFDPHGKYEKMDTLLLDIKRPLPCYKVEQQSWIGMLKSSSWSPMYANEAAMSKIDFLVGDHPQSDLQLAPEWIPEGIEALSIVKADDYARRASRPLLAAFLCRERSRRKHRAVRLFTELAGLGVSGKLFGSCIPLSSQVDEEEEPLFIGRSLDDLNVVEHLLSKHMFALVSERTDCSYAHSGKIFTAMRAGCIPVYLGSPSIKNYLPQGSVVVASDFNNVTQLASYLLNVASDVDLFKSHHAW